MKDTLLAWEIRPKKQQCKVFVLQDNKFVLYSETEKSDLIRSQVLEGLELAVSGLFD
ncbi:MAG: hypothetical protein HC880_20120 [Bacteroidia bacterium]|nr:hypothetical protein [Bacteroidia bacterium]